MRKANAIRIAGFVGALGASALLIGAAVQGTGAYFTDSHTGEIDASTGDVNVSISPADGKLSFANLLPGDYKDVNLGYTAHGTAAEDIWLVFPTNGDAEAFVGAAGDTAGGGLGRYGHFALTSTGGAHFTSYNLNNPGTGIHDGDLCPTNTNGWGGSNDQPTSPSDTTTAAFCAPRNAILLDSGLTNGQGGTATFTFGFTPLQTAPQDAPSNKVVSYKIVATQAGIRPDNPFNGPNP
jgi:hypothetical protein